MRAVIMAGGKGTRLRSLTHDEIPKTLAPVNGKPILQWQIECLRRNGIEEICIVTGHLGEKIRETLRDGGRLGVTLQYFHEETPLGTAGALAYLKPFVQGEAFLLIYGDCVFDIDFRRMAAFHRSCGAVATLFAHPNAHPYDSDLLAVGSTGRIEGFFAKNSPRDGWYDNMVNAGVYVLSPEICTAIPEGQRFDLEKEYLLPQIPGGGIFGYRSSEYIKDAGTPERICAVAEDIKKGIVQARNLNNRQRCVFLDRDGTINADKGLVFCPEDFELLPSAVRGIKQLNDSGYLAIVITNQPVVARGLCGIDTVEEIHRKMKTLLGEAGAYIDAVYYCPHHPD